MVCFVLHVRQGDISHADTMSRLTDAQRTGELFIHHTLERQIAPTNTLHITYMLNIYQKI